MKLLVLICLILSTKAFANVNDFPKDLSSLYSTLEEVPYLHGNNTLAGIPTEVFTLQSARETVAGHGIVVYGVSMTSDEFGCNEEDYFSITLYTFEDTVKFAIPSRSFGCHED